MRIETMTIRRIATSFLATGMMATCLASAVQAQQSVLIRLHRQARVEGSAILLKDVATVVHTVPEVQQRLENIILGPAPAGGRQRQLSYAEIRSRLRAVGVDLSRVRFSGRSAVTVSGKTAKFGGNRRLPRGTMKSRIRQRQQAEKRIARAITQFLSRHAPELGRVSVLVRVAEADVSLVLSVVDGGYEVRGGRPPWHLPQSFQIRFIDRRERIQQIVVRGRIDQLPYVLAAKYTIPRGELIRREDLVWQQVEDVKNAATRYADVVGRETKRTIRRNERIERKSIRRIPMIRSNDVVTVYSRGPGFQVSRMMKSRGVGSVGETITLVVAEG
ncbi:MAG: flagellar basal body P-ring formation protein FlgA, partial [Planctomycetes bacterium]|nr:flagellar basal body P-ring formation protein FlgA [Planctomycetota bacterium]